MSSIALSLNIKQTLGQMVEIRTLKGVNALHIGLLARKLATDRERIDHMRLAQTAIAGHPDTMEAVDFHAGWTCWEGWKRADA